MIQVDWKEFKDESELPLNKDLIVKWDNGNITIDSFIKSGEIIIMYDEDCTYVLKNMKSKIIAWSTLEEKPKELITYSFSLSETEVQQLNNLLDLASDRLDSMSFRDHEYLESNLKKFQDLFSKVEF